MRFPEAIRRIKNAAEDRLLAIDGVTGVDLGATDAGACIRVYVRKKIALEVLAESARIPAQVDGIPTDVIERAFELHADTGLYDPLIGGISVGACRKVNGRFTVGTLGCCVRDNTTDKVSLLSSFHALAGDAAWSTNDTVTQPAIIDGGVCPTNVVATITAAVLTDRTDCAMAVVQSRKLISKIADIGPVRGSAAAAVGEKVQKRGRTTGLTLGVIDSLDLTVRLDTATGPRVFRNQIGIAVAAGYSARFGLPGDSGAALMNGDNAVVGLYIGGTPDGTYGVANHIGDVLAALNARICPGGSPKIKGEKQEKGEGKIEKPEKWEKAEGKWEKVEGKWEKGEKRELGDKGAMTPEEHTKFEIDRWKAMSGKEPGKEHELKVGIDFPPVPAPGAEKPDRLDEIEKHVAELRHFIDESLRPNLDRGALLGEPDLKPAKPKQPRKRR